MTVSGVVSGTVFKTRKVIDHAYRRCRIQPEQITSEMIVTATDSLYLLLSSLSNQGTPLWCIEKLILPMYLNQIEVYTPKGTVDLLNQNWRSVTQLVTSQSPGNSYSSAGGTVSYAFDDNLDTSCQQTTPDGFIVADMSSQTAFSTLGVMMGDTTSYDLVFEASNDLSVWTTVLAPGPVDYVAGQWQWYDIDGLPPYQYVRMRETGGNIMNVVEFYVANNPREIPLARLNKDDYINLPNKTFQGRPLQFWLDRQREYPIMYLWPAPNPAAQFQQIIAWRSRQIMDVGTLTETLDIPQRWYEAIVWQLSWRLAQETPQVDPSLVPGIKQTADEALYFARAEERDKSPIYIAPNISWYTR